MYACSRIVWFQADINLFWLSLNPQGQWPCGGETLQGYASQGVFPPARFEFEWSSYTRIDDCIGIVTFSQAGRHVHCLCHFPTADVSWGSISRPSSGIKRTFTDKNGVTHRESVAFCASVGGYRAPESAIAPTPQLGYPTTIVGSEIGSLTARSMRSIRNSTRTMERRLSLDGPSPTKWRT